MCARLVLNAAKTFFDLKKYDRAFDLCSQLTDDYAGTFAVPEGIFYKGVIGYKKSNEPKSLREALNRLRRDFPDNEWTMRAKPYEGIEA